MAGISLAFDYANGVRFRAELQNTLDGAVLAGARETVNQQDAAEAYFEATLGGDPEDPNFPAATFALDGQTLKGSVSARFELTFGKLILNPNSIAVDVRSEAVIKSPQSAPCIIVLANAPQALLLNSGAKINAPGCDVDVHSTQNPAFIMNAGVTLDVKKLCVKGTQYIKNGGTLSNLETNCAVTADPYAGKIPEPTVPTTCTTSGAKDGTSHTLNPGAHCSVNFNGSPTITFKPGLHIIKGTMIVNSGSKIIADGVTFYFPDTDSKIQANGNLTMTATAPTSGSYKDILMFEKTSDPSNNANKRQYVFNGSNGEYLEGAIYLPNRDVTYNSTTNVMASKLSMVVNTMIMNSANWSFEGLSGSSAGKTVYLSR